MKKTLLIGILMMFMIVATVSATANNLPIIDDFEDGTLHTSFVNDCPFGGSLTETAGYMRYSCNDFGGGIQVQANAISHLLAVEENLYFEVKNLVLDSYFDDWTVIDNPEMIRHSGGSSWTVCGSGVSMSAPQTGDDWSFNLTINKDDDTCVYEIKRNGGVVGSGTVNSYTNFFGNTLYIGMPFDFDTPQVVDIDNFYWSQTDYGTKTGFTGECLFEDDFNRPDNETIGPIPTWNETGTVNTGNVSLSNGSVYFYALGNGPAYLWLNHTESDEMFIEFDTMVIGPSSSGWFTTYRWTPYLIDGGSFDVSGNGNATHVPLYQGGGSQHQFTGYYIPRNEWVHVKVSIWDYKANVTFGDGSFDINFDKGSPSDLYTWLFSATYSNPGDSIPREMRIDNYFAYNGTDASVCTLGAGSGNSATDVENFTIVGGVTNVTIGGNQASNSGTYSGEQEVAIKFNGNDLVVFDHDFDVGAINFSKISVVRGSDSVVVNASGEIGNKTIYLDDNGYASLCVKDAEIASVSEISSSCDGSDEYDFTSCIGGSDTQGNITCVDEGSRFRIEGLQHSGVLGVPVSVPFSDDFEDGSINTTWGITGNDSINTVVETGGVLNITQGNESLNLTVSTGYVANISDGDTIYVNVSYIDYTEEFSLGIFQNDLSCGLIEVDFNGIYLNGTQLGSFELGAGTQLILNYDLTDVTDWEYDLIIDFYDGSSWNQYTPTFNSELCSGTENITFKFQSKETNGARTPTMNLVADFSWQEEVPKTQINLSPYYVVIDHEYLTNTLKGQAYAYNGSENGNYSVEWEMHNNDVLNASGISAQATGWHNPFSQTIPKTVNDTWMFNARFFNDTHESPWYNVTIEIPAGSGTLGNPLQVDTCLKLQYLEFSDYAVQSSNQYAEFIADVDCSESRNWRSGLGYKGFGGNGNYRTVFDGHGYTVSNIYTNVSTLTWLNEQSGSVGFSEYSGVVGTIQNVNVLNSTFHASAGSAGAIEGVAYGPVLNSSAINCTVISDTGYAGGAIGANTGNGGTTTLSDISVIGTNVYSGNRAGGLLAGQVSFARTIDVTNFLFKDSTITAPYAGGVIGYSTNSGANYHGNISVINSVINGSTNAGGFWGYARSMTNNINDVHIDENTIIDGGVVGGIAGRVYSGSYVWTNVVSNAQLVGSTAGGIIGQSTDGSTTTLNYTYFNSDNAGTTTCVAGSHTIDDTNCVDYTDTEMKIASNMATLDFTSTWGVYDTGYVGLLSEEGVSLYTLPLSIYPSLADNILLYMPMDTHLGQTQYTFNNITTSPITVTPYDYDGNDNTPYIASVSVGGILRYGSSFTTSTVSSAMTKLRLNNVPDPQYDNFTLSFWYRPITNTGQNQTIAGDLDSGTGWALYYNYGGDTKNITFVNGTGDVLFEGDISIPTNRYTHIMLERADGVAYLYINNTLAGQATFGQNVTYNAGRMFLGSAKQVDIDENPDSYYWWRYYLDEVSYFNRSLNDPEKALLQESDNPYKVGKPENPFTSDIEEILEVNSPALGFSFVTGNMTLGINYNEQNNYLIHYYIDWYKNGVLDSSEDYLTSEGSQTIAHIIPTRQDIWSANVTIVGVNGYTNESEAFNLQIPVGEDSTANPGNVTTCLELYTWMRSGKINSGSSTYAEMQLMNDIDCSDTVNWFDGQGYLGTMSGYQYKMYGNDYTISGLYKNSGAGGFFQGTGYGRFSIQDVHFVNATNYCSGDCAFLTGRAGTGASGQQNYYVTDSTFDDIHIQGTGNTALIASYVSSSNNEGPFVDNMTVTNSYFQGTNVGMWAGDLRSGGAGYVYNSYFENVTLKGNYVGGILGYSNDNTNEEFMRVYDSEFHNINVTATQYGGVLVGYYLGSSSLTQFTVRDTVIDESIVDATNCGGLFGLTNFMNNYPYTQRVVSSVNLTECTNKGAFAYSINNNGVLYDVYVDSDKAGTSSFTFAGTPDIFTRSSANTTSELQSHLTYAQSFYTTMPWTDWRYYDGSLPTLWLHHPQAENVVPYDSVLSVENESVFIVEHYDMNTVTDAILMFNWDEYDNVTAIDISGNGYNGTAQNTNGGLTSKGVDGYINGGYWQNDLYSKPNKPYISVPHNDIFALNHTGVMTVAFWFNHTASLGRSEYLFNKGTFDDWDYRIRGDTDGSITMGYKIQYCGSCYASQGFNVGNYADDQFHHVVAIFDVNLLQLHLYFDGVYYFSQEGGFPSGNGYDDSGHDLAIGGTDNQVMRGVMDEFSMYNRIVNASEVEAMLQAGKQRVGYPYETEVYVPLDLSATVYEPDLDSLQAWFTLSSDTNTTTLLNESKSTTDSMSIEVYNLDRGEYDWSVAVQDKDGITVTTSSFTIANAGPTVESVIMHPPYITPNHTIQGRCVISDIDGGNITYIYKFIKNGVPYDEVNVSVEESSLFIAENGETPVVGDVWAFACAGYDGTTMSNFTYSDNHTIVVNTEPIMNNASTNSPADTGTLTATCNATDLNNDTITMNWRMYKNDVLYSSGSQSAVLDADTTVSTISSGALVYGDEWFVSCSVNDWLDTSEYINSTPVTITKDPQTPTTNYERLFPIILFQNESLSATSSGNDVNLDTINFTFLLYVDDVNVENKTDNEKTNGQEASVNFDYSSVAVGEDVKVGIIVEDVDGVSTEVFSDEFTVRASNNVPYVDSIRVSPTTFIGEDDNVKGYCAGIDTDGDTINYNYRWYVNNAIVKSGSKVYSAYYGYSSGTEILVDTISSSYYSEGDTLKFSCSTYDAKNDSSYVNDTEDYIFGDNNFAPTMKQVVIVPYGHQDTQVSFNVSANATDIDLEDIQFEWRFVKNGQYQSVTTTAYYSQGVYTLIGTLLEDDTQAGDTYYVRARAYDGEAYSGWMASNVVTIDNTPPTMVNSIITASPLEDTALTSYCDASDIDVEQDITFNKTWYKNGVATYYGSTLPASLTQEEETWILGCVAYDGYNYSSELNSTPVAIIGTDNFPVFENVSLMANSTDAMATCLVSDADGDPLNYSVSWYINGVLNSTINTTDVAQNVEQSYNLSRNFVGGDNITFVCQAIDEQGLAGPEEATVIVPEITFNYVVDEITAQTIEVSWTTDADSVKVYLNGLLQTETTLIKWTFEGLMPSTLYEISLVPVKDGFIGQSYDFNETTEATDNNNPTISSVSISPGVVYTEDSVTGYCTAEDVDTSNIFFTYTWRVNNVSVDTGVTSLYERGTQVVIGSLTSSNYVFNDTISLTCNAFDGIGNSGENTTELIVQNTEPVVEEELISIELEGLNYSCTHEYSDADGDAEITPSYQWYLNGVLNQSGNSSQFPIDMTEADDQIVCQINTGDAYHNLSKNSSTFVVGDFEVPVVSNTVIPTTAFTDTEVELSTVCSDNIAVANLYPKIRFINPNYVEEEYQFYYDGNLQDGDPDNDNDYTRYLRFSIAGTYTNFEVECKDGNGNTEIVKLDDVLLSKVRANTENTGGSGSSAYCGDGTCNGNENQDTCPLDCGEKPEAFEISEDQGFTISPGQTKIIEFEVINKLEEDVSFTTAILVGDDPEAYEWMEFEGGIKAFTFDIKNLGGLSSDNKYIRYYVTIPEDAELGTYEGIIEINGKEQTKQHMVTIEVTEGGINFLGFLSYELFEIPFTSQPITGQVIGAGSEGDEPGRPFTVLHLLISLSVVGLLMVGYRMLMGL